MQQKQVVTATVGATTISSSAPITKATAPVVERKRITQPGLNLVSKNVGIKSILEPAKNKQMENEDALLPDLAESFSHSDLMAVWKAYALNLQREKKTSLYSTLMGSEPLVSSDYAITLEIANSSQVKDLETEKAALLGHIRSQLKNYKITFNYKISEKKQSLSTTDTKATFDKLAEDNPSLHKFRKLFNLDIDF